MTFDLQISISSRKATSSAAVVAIKFILLSDGTILPERIYGGDASPRLTEYTQSKIKGE